MSLMKEFRIDMALELMPVSGCTCAVISSIEFYSHAPSLPSTNLSGISFA